ncbi:hypothetical protein PT974_07575 [Cladobotryum mycophilum]|uniref:Zn(2)-C6 fungal-type domain-containing protein n=1 Tax=Cladobotryum mycophilum TaxID=491253 RepID=A0ABR0SPN1_9HYPO
MPPQHRQSRSRGCKQCIQRHVKVNTAPFPDIATCDERPGCCKQCTRFGFPCSGPISGAVFLDMTEKASRIRRSSQPKRKRASKEKDTPNNREDISGNTTERDESTTPGASFSMSPQLVAQGHVREEIDEESADFDDYLLKNHQKLYDQPSPQSALDTTRYTESAFVSQFVSLISSSRRGYSPLRQRSWIFELPELVATTSMPSVRYSIRAAALIYHAVARQNRKAGMDAVHWYLAGMKSYRASILGPGAQRQTSAGSKPSRLPDYRVICVPLMFSFFEGMQGITSDAELQHHVAAAEMVELRGPEGCVSGMEHGMMRSLRSMEAFHSIMQNRQARFSSPEWLSLPFQQNKKIRYDLLVDILLSFTRELRLPHIQQPGANLPDSIHYIHDLPNYRKDDMEEKATDLMNRLHDWWRGFEKEHQEIIFPDCLYFPPLTDTAAPSPASVLPMSASWMFSGRETLAASMVSLYSAANIILHSVLLVIALSKPVGSEVESAVPAHQAAIASHSTSVFHAAMYLKVINPFCGDSVRAIFSTRIVFLLALENTQREKAQSMLREWGLSNEDVVGSVNARTNTPGTC